MEKQRLVLKLLLNADGDAFSLYHKYHSFNNASSSHFTTLASKILKKCVNEGGGEGGREEEDE